MATKALKPAGYSAIAENMVKPIIFIGSTILVIIACYVLAKPQLIAVIGGKASTEDYLVLGLVAGLGLIIDTVINVSASRFRMHLSRGKQDMVWTIINGIVLLMTLGAEGMTLMYFGGIIDPANTPPMIIGVIAWIHGVLYFFRYPSIPILLFYLIACVLPLSIEAADRDRQTKATTSVNIAGLQESLVQVAVGAASSIEQKIRALADQMAINEHASHAQADEIERNAILINKLCAQNGLDPMVSVSGESIVINAKQLPPATVTPITYPTTALPMHNGHSATMAIPPPEQTLNLADLPVYESYNDVAPRRRSTPVRTKPIPGGKDYPAFIEEERRRLVSQELDSDDQAIADSLNERIEDVRMGLIAYQEQQVQEAKPKRKRTAR